ncbi:MAG TPA: ATP-binding protein [Verrucomicrobiae bacterium]|nr:ATP-binding protein [Verrucomicrobiae bacterium]
MDESISETEGRFRHLIDSVPLLIFVSDAAGNGVYFNREWLAFTGHSFENLSGHRWIDDLHPDDRVECMEQFNAALGVQESFSFECRLRRYDGDYHHVLNIGVPDFAGDGRFLGYIDTAVDVNNQKAAEEALRYSEMRCDALFGPSVGNVALVDCSGRIIAVNDGWLRFTRRHGHQPKIGTGANYLEVCRRVMMSADHDARAAREGIAAVLDGSRSEFHLEYRCVGNAEEWFEMIVHPLRRWEGGAIITHLNITSRRQAEMQTQILSQELAHANRVAALGELTASFAHELNQPLTAILTNAQAAKRLVDKTRGPKGIEPILSDIISDDLRAGKIIQSLRAMLKKGPARFRPIKVNKLIEDVMTLVHEDAVLRRVESSLLLDPSAPTVWGDRIQLQQVILNLVMNAFEAMDAADVTIRRLTIKTQIADKRSIVVLVRDSGPGVSPERLGRLFEPFFTTKAGGLGMGLVICRSIVQAHRGEITAINNAGGGASFRVVLPVYGKGRV